MSEKSGSKGSYFYAIKRGNRYLQGTEPNPDYQRYSMAPTMGNRHTYNEYRTVWGKEYKTFERMTIQGYIKVLMEEYRWGAKVAMDFKVIPVPENNSH